MIAAVSVVLGIVLLIMVINFRAKLPEWVDLWIGIVMHVLVGLVGLAFLITIIR